MIKYCTVKELSKLYPSFSEASLRYLIFNRNKNGFAQCLRKVGKKILIDTVAFEAWINSQTIND